MFLTLLYFQLTIVVQTAEYTETLPPVSPGTGV